MPQAGADTMRKAASVWVVPNPYRGFRQIKDRPSSWDLTPNASDPTGTHIDFIGLPSGDVDDQDLHRVRATSVADAQFATTPVNESIACAGHGHRHHGETRPGFNRQQDNPNDGQARWNLISRNGQDVVSGIYLFTVELAAPCKHRGKFVIIR